MCLHPHVPCRQDIEKPVCYKQMNGYKYEIYMHTLLLLLSRLSHVQLCAAP